MQEYENINILEGTLNFKGVDYKLTAFDDTGKNTIQSNKTIQVANKEQAIAKRMAIGEVAEIKSSDEVVDSITYSSFGEYIQPVAVYKEKILGFIPNPWGKNIVEVRAFKEGELNTYKIKEGQTKAINGYNVQVESATSEGVELKIVE